MRARWSQGARVLALVDSLQARARFARAYDCVAPAFDAGAAAP